MNTVGKRLKAWRKSKALTLEEVAGIIDATEWDLLSIENDICLPSFNTLNKLKIFTDIDFRWFLFGEGSGLQV